MAQVTQTLDTTALRLRSNATVEALPLNDDFWPRLAQGALGDFHHEFLVTQHSFSGRWAQSEMHPNGDEIICLLAGSATFVLEHPDGAEHLALDRLGALVVVPQGIWHHAYSEAGCTLLFITAGEGTQHRPAPE
ncbi:cupin [Saccharospirillum mangrovi]|uniref:cupin n=1 Tax=Saccharospirillum mangrovi TaxID=2161747 RepID=UPI000D33368F|nr:cupin [Saccharospirillum mangrovi]